MKLIQKSLLKGTRSYELIGDEVHIHTKTPLKEKHKTVPLAILNPDPEIEGNQLHFHSRVKCGPLISLDINKPDEASFNNFVEMVKNKALNEYNAFAGISDLPNLE